MSAVLVGWVWSESGSFAGKPAQPMSEPFMAFMFDVFSVFRNFLFQFHAENRSVNVMFC